MTTTAQPPEALAEWFERVTGQPMKGRDSRAADAFFVQDLLNRADLTPDKLRTRLGHLARCSKPGIQVEYVIELWKQWDAINPRTRAEEDKKLRLDFEVYKAACALVTPASAS